MFFEIKVNGEAVAVVSCDEVPTLEQVKEFLPVHGVSVTELDAVTCSMVSDPKETKNNLVPFRTNAYMQVDTIAIKKHLNNIINTYGDEALRNVLEVEFKLEVKPKVA